MARKKKLKVGNLLLTLNVIAILGILGFYSSRLIKYYKLEHKKNGEQDSSLLVDKLFKKKQYVDLTKGLVCDEDNGTCKYKGNVTDNYLKYSGMLYRIIGIDNKNNAVAVSEDVVTLMYTGLENGYDKSYINKWLNKSDLDHSGIYESVLYDEDTLDYTRSCEDSIDDLEKITCEEINSNNKISLLSLYDYKEAGGKSSFLNNGQSYFLLSRDKDGNAYYITPEGDISVNKNLNTVAGVRPVITINYNTELLSGKGTKENPYIIEKHDIKTLADAYVNNYVEFDGQVFKIVNKDDESVKLASAEVLKDGENNYETYFSKTTNKYVKNSNISNYLNGTYLNSFESKDLILEKPWYVGNLELGALDYINKYKESSKLKIGMLGLADMFVQDLNNIFTISRGIESSDVIMIIKEDGTVFSDAISNNHNVRSAFYVSNKIEIASGDGSLKSPFKLGGVQDEENE